jgi:hypothetical protein
MGINQASIHNHLLKMATLPNLINADLVRDPLSSQRFSPVVVSAMQKKGILGITSRYVIILNQRYWMDIITI